jgi:hypothetical protein
MRVRVLAARRARGLRSLRPSSRKQRAQGKPGARCTRGLVCKLHIRKRTRAYRFSGGNPAFPAQWFTTYFVLSPVTGFLATVTSLGLILRNLAPAPGRQDHTTSPSAESALVSRAPRVHRIPPHVRDDRETPLISGGTGRANSADLPDGLNGIFLREGLDRFLLICPSG